MEKSNTFVFFGMAGSGKGTQIELLKNYLEKNNISKEFVFASPGNEYRKIVSSGGYSGFYIKEIMHQGLLLPDFLTTSLINTEIVNKITEDSSIIADGYPRTINQSIALEQILNFFKRDSAHIIYIEVSREEAVKRMKLRARSDDTDEGIIKRFDEYVNNVLPAMDYFKDKPGYIIYKINGEQSIEEVHQEIIKSLNI